MSSQASNSQLGIQFLNQRVVSQSLNFQYTSDDQLWKQLIAQEKKSSRSKQSEQMHSFGRYLEQQIVQKHPQYLQKKQLSQKIQNYGPQQYRKQASPLKYDQGQQKLKNLTISLNKKNLNVLQRSKQEISVKSDTKKDEDQNDNSFQIQDLINQNQNDEVNVHDTIQKLKKLQTSEQKEFYIFKNKKPQIRIYNNYRQIDDNRIVGNLALIKRKQRKQTLSAQSWKNKAKIIIKRPLSNLI